MRKGVTVIVVVTAAVLGTWWFWPKPEATTLTKRAATGEDEGEPSAAKPENSQSPVASNDRDAQALVVPKNDPPRAQDVVDAQANEDALVDEMLAILKSDPKRAEQLGRAHQKRFPEGARSDEADALVVYAIYNQRRLLIAQQEVLEYYKRHPDGEYTEKLIQLTRVRPPDL